MWLDVDRYTIISPGQGSHLRRSVVTASSAGTGNMRLTIDEIYIYIAKVWNLALNSESFFSFTSTQNRRARTMESASALVFWNSRSILENSMERIPSWSSLEDIWKPFRTKTKEFTLFLTVTFETIWSKLNILMPIRMSKKAIESFDQAMVSWWETVFDEISSAEVEMRGARPEIALRLYLKRASPLSPSNPRITGTPQLFIRNITY